MRTKQSKANREARAAGKARQVRSSALGKLLITVAEGKNNVKCIGKLRWNIRCLRGKSGITEGCISIFICNRYGIIIGYFVLCICRGICCKSLHILRFREGFLRSGHIGRCGNLFTVLHQRHRQPHACREEKMEHIGISLHQRKQSF